MMNDSIKTEIFDEIACITLNRPKAFNAFDLDTIQFLSERLVEIASDEAIKGVVLTGEGKVFCAGGDLKWVHTCGTSFGDAFHRLAARYHQAVLEIRRMPKPVIAAVNGLAAGGGFSMALACDFRIMENGASLRQGYTSNGLSIDGGGTFTLPRLVGLSKALEIAAFDEPIDAQQALAWGLVTEVVDAGKALERGMEMAGMIKQRSLSSFAASKKLLTDAFNTPFEVQLEREREMLSWCADHPNGKEGIRAFIEKRNPEFI